jgi:hypothetical protein
MNKKCYCGFKGWNWQPPFWRLHNKACKQHDENYSKGGSRLERIRVDYLFLCDMIARGVVNYFEALVLLIRGSLAILTAPIYFVAVLIFGWKTWNLQKKSTSNKMESNDKRS